MMTVNNIDSVFSALADPTRRAILARLAQGEAGVLELSEPFQISQPAISRHLSVLEKAGLISRRIDRSRRPCRIRPEGLENLHSWLQMMRDAMEANYSRLDLLLANQTEENNEQT
jgi:DNA-binding transcriptional ArsR family regulator